MSRGNQWANQVLALRRIFQPKLPVPCSKCPEPVYAWQQWDLDHIVPVDQGGELLSIDNLWPSHASCNRAEGARITNKKRSKKAQRVRDWL